MNQREKFREKNKHKITLEFEANKKKFQLLIDIEGRADTKTAAQKNSFQKSQKFEEADHCKPCLLTDCSNDVIVSTQKQNKTAR